MSEGKNGRETTGNALVVLYETSGTVEYHYEGGSYVVENEGVANQLRDLGVSPSEIIMVPVELNNGSTHILGRVIDDKEMFVASHRKERVQLQIDEEKKSRAEWAKTTRELLFTPMDSYKDDFPFGFEAFALADYRGLQGFTLFYSNRIGKFYMKTDDIVREDGDLDLFVRGVVEGWESLPRGVVDRQYSIPLLQGIRQPNTAKSIKIIKMTEIVFKGILFTGWHKNKFCGEERWIGWNDHIGIPKFTTKCSRNILKKNSDWDFRLTFATFTSFFNPNSREWRITELSYSNLEIAKQDEQIPCSLFIIDDLQFEAAIDGQGVFVSRNSERHDGSPLKVVVSDENCIFDPHNIRPEYAAIACPVYSNGGLVVSFRALALFAREEWLKDPYRKELVKQFYTWTAGRHLTEKISEYYMPKMQLS
ncbi:hypothetical protein PMAYCL1PPCAC_23691 [Pristionchus mayeri]|uniref:Uncharacterized protein n=1 Tax=Pristionchus mayeri TaxID=1317129 RepID=A0AAN5CYP1_9BILA|nr:hypothetical protein PMAYCL1PPCAC_23691 [Pristionchus mayeri]